MHNAIGYAREEGMTEKVRNAYKTLVPNLAIHVASVYFTLLTSDALFVSASSSIQSCFEGLSTQTHFEGLRSLPGRVQCMVDSDDNMVKNFSLVALGAIGIVAIGHIAGRLLARRVVSGQSAEKVEKPTITSPQDKISSLSSPAMNAA